jgi:hypothetical protein
MARGRNKEATQIHDREDKRKTSLNYVWESLAFMGHFEVWIRDGKYCVQDQLINNLAEAANMRLLGDK